MDVRDIEHYCLILEAMETNLHNYRKLKNDLMKVRDISSLYKRTSERNFPKLNSGH